MRAAWALRLLRLTAGPREAVAAALALSARFAADGGAPLAAVATLAAFGLFGAPRHPPVPLLGAVWDRPLPRLSDAARRALLLGGAEEPGGCEARMGSEL